MQKKNPEKKSGGSVAEDRWSRKSNTPCENKSPHFQDKAWNPTVFKVEFFENSAKGSFLPCLFLFQTCFSRIVLFSDLLVPILMFKCETRYVNIAIVPLYGNNRKEALDHNFGMFRSLFKIARLARKYNSLKTGPKQKQAWQNSSFKFISVYYEICKQKVD